MIYLGSIVVPAGGYKTNLTTTTPFDISAQFVAVLVRTPVSATVFHVAVGASTGLVSNATEFPVAGNSSSEFSTEFGAPTPPIVAIYSGGAGGTCDVFGLYGLAIVDQPQP